jgi:hypothetical protein
MQSLLFEHGRRQRRRFFFFSLRLNLWLDRGALSGKGFPAPDSV